MGKIFISNHACPPLIDGNMTCAYLYDGGVVGLGEAGRVVVTVQHLHHYCSGTRHSGYTTVQHLNLQVVVWCL